MSVQQQRQFSQDTQQDTKYKEIQEDMVPASPIYVRHRPVTRSHIQKSLASAAFFGVVLSLLSCFIIEKRSGFPYIEQFLFTYLFIFGFPVLFTLLSGWATQYRRLSFLTGALFGFTYICGLIAVRYFQTGTVYSHEFWLCLLPLTIGGAFFASLGASIRWHVEHPKSSRKIEKR
jgi:hypothetical protein